jgi:hypothetical protein
MGNLREDEREDWAHSSLVVTVSTNRLIYMAFSSNAGFQSGQTCYYFYMFSIQTILFFLYYEVPPIFLCYVFSPLYLVFPYYYNKTYLKIFENLVL